MLSGSPVVKLPRYHPENLRTAQRTTMTTAQRTTQITLIIARKFSTGMNAGILFPDPRA